MKKNLVNIILCSALVVVLAICFFASGNVKKTGEENNAAIELQAMIQRAQEESAEVKPEERREFVSASLDYYITHYNKTDKKRLFLIASSSCGFCQVAEPIIENIAYKHNIKIYYVDSSKFTSDEYNKFKESNSAFNEGFGTPILLLVSDGKIHDMVDGLADTAGYENFFKKNGFISG